MRNTTANASRQYWLRRILVWIGILGAISLFLPLLSLYVTVRPPPIISGNTPEQFGVEYEQVSFETTDGISLAGWFIPAAQNEDGAPTLIFLHGYPAEKGDILPVALAFQDSYNLLLFDFRYFGGSDGWISTVGMRETRDLLAATQYLEDQGVESIGVWGFSMGGAVALMGAAQTDAIDVVVADSSYADLGRMASHQFFVPVIRDYLGQIVSGWARLFFGRSPHTVSPEKSSEALSIPVLVTHSRSDVTIPVSHAERIRSATEGKGQFEFWIRNDAAHGFLGEAYYERVRSFFDTHLRH